MNKKRKKGSIIALVLLIIILISGGFLIFYLFFSNYKDIIKKEKSIFISYELNKGNQLVDDKKRIINSYSNYEDDDVKISINKKVVNVYGTCSIKKNTKKTLYFFYLLHFTKLFIKFSIFLI